MMHSKCPPERKASPHRAGHMVLEQTIFGFQRGSLVSNLVDINFADSGKINILSIKMLKCNMKLLFSPST